MASTMPKLEQIHQTVSQDLTNRNFKVTFERLWELKDIDEDVEEEDEIFCPSEYAFSTAIHLLFDLSQRVGELFPLGYASVDSQGGANLIWRCREQDKEIRLNLPYAAQPLHSSVYVRQNSESRLIDNPSVTQLANLLQWLFADDRELDDAPCLDRKS